MSVLSESMKASMGDPYVRVATPNDAEELLAIYAPYVLHTAISFEYEPPTVAEFKSRIEKTLAFYPYLAAMRGGTIVGYAYAGSFHTRQAYRWGAETTVYVKEDQKGQGLGRLLYRALEGAAKAQGVLNLNACIGYPDGADEYLTRASAAFHQHMGYSLVGEFHQCGYKFGRWYNMIWMEKHIGAHTAPPPPVVPFPALSADTLKTLGIRA